MMSVEGSKVRPEMNRPLIGTNNMARKKTSILLVNAKLAISQRLREVRLELFGFNGSALLASKLNLPARTWYNYEAGVTVPGEVLLAFVVLTGVSPTWILRGEGPRYSADISRDVEFSQRDFSQYPGYRSPDSAVPHLLTVDTSSLDMEAIDAPEVAQAV